MTSCAGKRQDGMPCRAKAMTGSPYCFFHDPDQKREQAQARIAGGRARRAPVLPDVPAPADLTSGQEVAALLSRTIQHVLTGQVDPRVANCAGYLCGVLLKALEVGALEDRLAVLEAAVKPGQLGGYLDREPVLASLPALADEERS